MPTQEPGTRLARALPYELDVFGQPDLSKQSFQINFGNSGKSAAVFHVRSVNTKTGPWTYTVKPDDQVTDNWNLAATNGAYDLSVCGPNGFLRSFKGTTGQNAANLNIATRYDVEGNGIILDIANLGKTCQLTILDAYTNDKTTHTLKAGEGYVKHWNLQKTHGWYDFIIELNTDPTFLYQVAGHVETGEDSMTDPAIGGSLPNFS